MRLRGWLAAGAVALFAQAAGAQQSVPPPYQEYRADMISGHGTAAEAGVGEVAVPDTYVRVAFDGAVGTTWRDGQSLLSGRVDIVGRFLLDMFRETRYGLSLGGGVSVPYVRGDAHLRPYLTAVADLETPRRGPITPAIQLGVGGGLRVGIVLRSSPANFR